MEANSWTIQGVRAAMETTPARWMGGAKDEGGFFFISERCFEVCFFVGFF